MNRRGCTILFLLFSMTAVRVAAQPTCGAPQVSLTVTGPDANGIVTGSGTWSFSDNDGGERWVTVQSTVLGHAYSLPWNGRAKSGSFSFSDNLMCHSPGSYDFKVEAWADGSGSCSGGYAYVTRQVQNVSNPSAKPSVSLTPAGQDADGNPQFTLTWSFPNTISASQRVLTVGREGAACDICWTSSLGGVSKASDTITYTPNTACMTPGTYNFVAHAQSCTGETTDANAPGDVSGGTPTITVNLFKHGPDNALELHAHYKFPLHTSQANRTVVIERLPDVNAGITGATLVTFSPAANEGDLDPVIQLGVVEKLTTFQGTASSTACSPAKIQKAQAADCSCGPTLPHPVRMSNGAMDYGDTEPLPQQSFLRLGRSYSSDDHAAGAFGIGWTSLFDAAIAKWGSDPNTVAVITTEGNERYVFWKTASGYVQTFPSSGTSLGALTESGTTMTMREPGSQTVRTFDTTTGRLTSITSLRDQRTLSIGYDASGHPSSVTDSWGTIALVVTANSSGRVTRIDVSGRPDVFWQYVYSGDYLTSVVAPDGGTWRQYDYTGGLLSAVHDPLGNLIESHTYDALGRATNSLGPGGDITSITYDPGTGAPTYGAHGTWASGEVTDFTVVSVGGGQRTASVTGGCTSCGNTSATYVYDDAGHVIREQDARGYIRESTYSYTGGKLLATVGPLQPSGCDPQTDPNQCRLTSDALAAATLSSTSLTRGTVYVYSDPNWPDLPTSISSVSILSNGNSRTETMTYDAVTGDVLTRSVTGYTGNPVRQETHTTTTTLYNGTEGAGFDPGGAFNASWLTIAQPSRLRKSVDGPRTDVSDVTQFVYYPIDPSVPAAWRGRLAAVKNAAGHVSSFSDYDVFGNALTVKDPNGVITTSTYDTAGRLLTSTVKGITGCDTTLDALCATDITSSRSYHPGAGPAWTETKPNGGVSTYGYDSRGRTSSVTRTLDATYTERMEYDFDNASGQKVAERATSTVPNTTGRSVAYLYDSKRRLQRVTWPDAAKVIYDYDAANALASVQDENHAAANTTYVYNANGRVAVVKQKLSTETAGWITTSYGYDINDNLVSVTDPNGNVTTYVYDDFGRMIKQTSPVTGVTTYDYDASDNLTTTTDANGATTTRIYDALSRLTSAVSAKSGSTSETVTWGYDATTAGAFGIGRLTATTFPNGSTAYAYERRGLLRSEQSTLGGATYATSFAYDADGNRKSIIYPSGDSAIYTFDYAGRPATLASVITSAVYLAFGPLKSMTYANGATKTMAYDSRYRITENKLTTASATIADYIYTEDSTGNITAIHDATDPTYNRDFGYDDLNRLVTANTGTSLWGTGSYTYDAMGNMTSRKLGTPAPDADPSNPLSVRARARVSGVSGTVDTLAFGYSSTTPKISVVTSNGIDRTVTYDNAGNETLYAAARMYSPRNLLSTVTDTSGEESSHVVSYGYDARGVRVSRSESPVATGTATRYYFYTPELQLLASTVDDNANLWGQRAALMTAGLPMNHVYGWFAGLPVAELGPPRTPNDTTELRAPKPPTTLAATNLFYTFPDHLGTPILQVDSTGAIVWRAEHEPYGNVWKMRTGARTDQPLRLHGQDLAMTWEGAEENYNVFRWYRAGWGRYNQADPVGLQGGVNLQAYVADNPIQFIDRYGMKAEIACTNIGIFGLKWTPFVHCGIHVTCENCEKGGKYDTFVELTRDRQSPGKELSVRDGPMPGGYTHFYEVGGVDQRDSCAFGNCVRQLAALYAPDTPRWTPQYSIFGPNSNTFAGHIMRTCGGQGPPQGPFGATGFNQPLWFD